jgi:hypothetical protein
MSVQQPGTDQSQEAGTQGMPAGKVATDENFGALMQGHLCCLLRSEQHVLWHWQAQPPHASTNLKAYISRCPLHLWAA